MGQVVQSIDDYLTVRVYGRSPRELEALGVELAWTPCPLGGERPWLICPHCGRSVGVLYYRDNPRASACRLCLGLTYPTTRMRPQSRLIRRAQAARLRLGGSPDLSKPLPERPARMHRSRYLRLRRQMKEREERIVAAFEACVGEMEAWLDLHRGQR